MTPVDPPILDHDPQRTALIEPGAWFAPIDIAPVAVMTWMRDVVDRLLADGALVERHRFVAESAVVPVWEMSTEGGKVAVTQAPVGAPMSAALLEVLVALGCRSVMAVGSCGGLRGDVAVGTVIVPDAAVREEGVSYHYLPPGRLARPDAKAQRTLRRVLAAGGFDVSEGMVWTTDAIFRETPAKVAARTAEGCVGVDMEAAALAAVAEFRAIPFGHAVYVADTLHDDTWDSTHLLRPDTAFRRRLFGAVVDAALSDPQA